MSYNIRLFWTFYKSMLAFNVLFPILCTIFNRVIINENPTSFADTMIFWNIVPICIVMLGTLLSFGYKKWAHPNECYFYNNRGVSMYQLMAFTMTINVLLGVSILIIKSYVTSS
jgi:ethanolamine transporter EutH